MKKIYRRGFPISLLIVPHSTLVSFLVLRFGKDSLRQRQNSLSPSNSGLEKNKTSLLNKKKKKEKGNAMH